MEMDLHQGINKGPAVKPKPYVRYIDFLVVLISLDLLHFLLSTIVWMALGPDKEDPLLTTLLPVLSFAVFWTKLGLAVLFFKKVPFRIDVVDASVEYRKIWTMSFFWPLLIKK